jgi:DNA-binding response OmpR family regulator
MEFYVRALRESGFGVEQLDTVEAALKHIAEVQQSPDIYILDIMMPPGNALTLEEAGYGLTSGVAIYRRLRAKFPRVPVIVLTNISNPKILDLLPFDDFTTREAKIAVLPLELVDIVKQRIGETT